MEYYVGLDVSLKQTTICVVDQTGLVVREGVVNSDPEAISVYVRSKAPDAVRIGLEFPDRRPRGCPRHTCGAQQSLTYSAREIGFSDACHCSGLAPRVGYGREPVSTSSLWLFFLRIQSTRNDTKLSVSVIPVHSF